MLHIGDRSSWLGATFYPEAHFFRSAVIFAPLAYHRITQLPMRASLQASYVHAKAHPASDKFKCGHPCAYFLRLLVLWAVNIYIYDGTLGPRGSMQLAHSS